MQQAREECTTLIPTTEVRQPNLHTFTKSVHTTNNKHTQNAEHTQPNTMPIICESFLITAISSPAQQRARKDSSSTHQAKTTS